MAAVFRLNDFPDHSPRRPGTANPAGFAGGLMIPPAAIIANPATTPQGATRTCTLRDSTAWPSQGRWSSKSI